MDLLFLLLEISIVSLVLFNLVVYSWAVKYIFVWRENDSIELKAVMGIGFLTILVCFYCLPNAISLAWFQSVPSMFLAAFSTVIFWGAARAKGSKTLTIAFTDDAPDFLLQSGPYQFMRHPFYTAYSLNWIAACILSLSPVVMIGSALLIALYYRAASLEEEKFGRTKLATKYLEYKQTTGMFLPRLFGRLSTRVMR